MFLHIAPHLYTVTGLHFRQINAHFAYQFMAGKLVIIIHKKHEVGFLDVVISGGKFKILVIKGIGGLPFD